MIRQIFPILLVSSTLLCADNLYAAGPNEAVQASPETEKHAPSGRVTNLRARAAKLSDRAAKLEGRKSNLDFLFDTERKRIEKVRRVSVPIDIIPKNNTAKTLQTVCMQAKQWAVTGSTTLNGAALKDYATGSRLGTELEELRMIPKQSIDLEGVRDRAGSLLAFGHEIGALCNRIDRVELEQQDIILLRAVFENKAARLDDYAGFRKAVADKIAKAAGSESNEADASTFISAIPTNSVSGRSQSLAAAGALNSVAQRAFEGLAEFLIDRAKEEALAFVRSNFAEQICGGDPGVFIPMTCEVLEKMEPTMALSSIGAALHAAVIDDLNELPDRLLVLAWLRIPDIAYPATVLRVVLPMLESAKARNSPIEYAASIYHIPSIDCEEETAADGDKRCADTMAVLRMSSALFRAVIQNTGGSTGDDVGVNININFVVLGVLFDAEQIVNAIPEKPRHHISTLLAIPGLWTGSHFEFSEKGLKDSNETIIRSIEAFESPYLKFAKLTEVNLGVALSPSDEAVLTLAHQSAVAMTEVSVELLDLLKTGIEKKGEAERSETEKKLLIKSAKIAAAFSAAPQLIESAKALQDEQWGHAALSLFQLVASIVESQAATTTEAEKFDKELDMLRKYLPLLVEVANAKSSADVNAALQAAFPAGGYRRKYVQGSVAINGFLGAYGGGTISNSLDANNNLAWGQASGEFAMFAPIGVHATAPVGKTKKRPWHLGGLVSVIDLGAITTSKWVSQEINPEETTDNGTSQTKVGEPAVFNIAGLVSPGAFFTVGIANSPFVFGVGASINPFAQKRTVTGRDSVGDIESVDEKFLPAIRFGVFLAVDITFVSFGLR